jgi:hypothetical protein
VQIGLTLRGYTKNNDRENIEKLRTKTVKKYFVEGLHVAEFVSNNILSKYIASLIDNTFSVEDISSKVTEVLNGIERNVIFVTRDTSIQETAETIITRIRTNVPNSFILASTRGAMKKHNEIIGLLQGKIPPEYRMESTQDDPERPIEQVTFINKISRID